LLQIGHPMARNAPRPAIVLTVVDRGSLDDDRGGAAVNGVAMPDVAGGATEYVAAMSPISGADSSHTAIANGSGGI